MSSVSLRTTISGPDAVDALTLYDAIRPRLSPTAFHRNAIPHYLDHLHRLCTDHNLRFRVLAGQWAHETGFGAGHWRDFNPAGLGITGGADTTPDTIPDALAAAHAHVWSMLVALRRWDDAARLGPPPTMPTWTARWTAKYRDPACPTVRTIDDLNILYSGNRATWMADPRGDAKLVSVINALTQAPLPDEGETTMPPIPAQTDVAQPRIYNLSTDYARYGISSAQAQAVLAGKFAKRNGGRPRVIVFHIQDGTTPGSLSHWARPDVDGSSTVMIQKDGSILRVIPEADGPWTNGDVMAPMPQAAEVLALGGNPNNWSLTIEAEGRPWDTMPKAQEDAIVWQTEDWIMRYPDLLGMTWTLLGHRHINSVTRINCGLYFQTIVDRVNAWLDGAVIPTEPPPPPVPPSPYPPGMSEELARELYGEVRVPWSRKVLAFDPSRSECQYWLARGKQALAPGEAWDEADQPQWPRLENVIRRGASKNVHVYQWSNGDVYEKVIRRDP